MRRRTVHWAFWPSSRGSWPGLVTGPSPKEPLGSVTIGVPLCETGTVCNVRPEPRARPSGPRPRSLSPLAFRAFVNLPPSKALVDGPFREIRRGPFPRFRPFFYRVFYRVVWDSRRRVITQRREVTFGFWGCPVAGGQRSATVRSWGPGPYRKAALVGITA